MHKAIRTVGPEHCTLSSDAGEPLFPNSVESLRLLRGYMSAFGCTADEIYRMSTVNPAFIVGLRLENEATSERGVTALTEEPLGWVDSNEQVAEDRRNGSRLSTN